MKSNITSQTTYFNKNDILVVPHYAKPLIQQGWLRALLSIVLFFIVVMIGGSLLGVSLAALITGSSLNDISNLISQSGTKSELALLAVQLMSLATTYLLVSMLGRYVDKAPLIKLNFAWKNFAADALKGLLMGFILIAIGFVVLWFMGNLTITNITFKPLSFLILLLTMACVAIGEELFTRGYIQYNLMQSVNKWVALVLASLLFSIMHGANPNIGAIPLFNIFLAGILLGLYYIFIQNLWFPIALHFAWNFFQGPIFGFEVSGLNMSSIIAHKVNGSQMLTGGEFGFEGSIIATALELLAIGLIYWYYKDKTNKVYFNNTQALATQHQQGLNTQKISQPTPPNFNQNTESDTDYSSLF